MDFSQPSHRNRATFTRLNFVEQNFGGFIFFDFFFGFFNLTPPLIYWIIELKNLINWWTSIFPQFNLLLKNYLDNNP